jgi:DNA polymerase-3 subunit beta
MKFIVSTSTLLDQLQQINGVVVSKPIFPILDNFLFDIKDGVLTVISTDLETSMTSTLKVDANEDISIAVPSKMTFETLKSLPEQPVAFSIDAETLAVEIGSDNGRYKLTGQNGDDFPKVPQVETDKSFSMPGNQLLKAISKTVFAASNDELRLNLTGVYVQLAAESITFVATDANKLVRFRHTDIKPGVEESFILPKKALNLLKSSLPNDDTPVTIAYNKSNASFSFGTVNLICRLIDERYPDYNAVIPSENPNRLTINRLELLNTVKRVALFANKTTHQIRIRLAGSEMNISAEDLDFSNEAQERLSCQYEGEDMEIGFNARYLIDMLNTLNTENVDMHLSTPSKAALLLPAVNEKNEDILMLIMPMMLNTYA